MSGNTDGLASIVGQIKAKLAVLDQTRGKLDAALKLLTDDKAGGAARPRPAKRSNGAAAAPADPPRPTFPS